MGTTLTAMQQAGFAGQYVVAIEGYKYLLTDGDPFRAIAAWTGTDWSLALPGLYVEHDHQQTADPWEPFNGGGTCVLRVQPDPSDTLAIDTHRKSAGAETQLVTTLDRSATTVPVLSTSTFAAGPSEAFVGTECFAYTGTTAGSFTGVTRGRYSPFKTSGGARFSEHHRVGFDPSQVQLQPLVTQQPRSWIGKWVGIWLHRIAGGALDTKDQAQLVFAGKIVETGDDANTGYVTIQCKDVLDVVKDSTLGRDIFRADIAEGTWLPRNSLFQFEDSNDGGFTFLKAFPLVVVASGASGVYQVNEGYYSLSQICDFLTQWLTTEWQAARIAGVYSLASPVNGSGTDLHTKIYWRVSTGTSGSGWFHLDMPATIAAFLGFTDVRSPGFASGTSRVIDFGPANTDLRKESDFTPWRTFVFNLTAGSPNGVSFAIQFAAGSVGAMTDQYALMPNWPNKPANPLGNKYGVFLMNDSFVFVGRLLSSGFPITPTGIDNIFFPPIGDMTGADTLYQQMINDRGFGVRASAVASPSLSIRQLFILEGTFETLVNAIFFSTGTAAFNDAVDGIGFGLGLNIPGELLSAFKASVASIPGKDNLLDVVIDETKKIAALMGGDFVLRRCFPRWRNGSLELGTFQTPTLVGSTASLTENNKAGPAENANNLRASTVLTSTLQKAIVKLDYNRDISKIGSDAFLSSIAFEDRVAVDDLGGDTPIVTIKASNTFSQFASTGAGVEALAPQFLATMPMFSRPVRMLTRPIAPPLYEPLSIGDIVSVTDSFARDPGTGRRGIVSRPGVILRKRYNRGGPTPSQPDKIIPTAGEVDVYFLDVNRIAAYAPSAKVDASAIAGGFDAGYSSGTFTLRCLAHEHSELTEPADAANFAASDKIQIVEIDPANAASPVTWQRTISTVIGNDITLTAALSSPAWDNTKTYRIVSDHFAVAQASQQTKAYQALSTSLQIENLASPDQYGHSAIGAFTAGALADAPELHASLSSGDGKAYDVGYDRGLGRLINNLLDVKTARQAPMLCQTICGNYTYSGGTGFEIVMIFPVFLGLEQPTTNALRRITVAPWIRSNNGSLITLRVSLCRTAPADLTVDDSILFTPFSQATFQSSSTTWATATALALQCGVKDLTTGLGWIVIESTLHGETRGLAQLTETNRQT